MDAHANRAANPGCSVLAFLPRFARVEDAEHQNGVTIVSVLKSVGATEDLEEEFAVFRPTCDRPSELRMAPKHVSASDEFARHTCREVGESGVEERGESIEVGKCVERPLDLYRPGHARNPGVPHVRSHWTTRSCDTGEPSVALAARRSSSTISSAVASLGTPSSAASSAINCGTVTPTSAARVSSTSAVCLSTSILTLAFMAAG